MATATDRYPIEPRPNVDERYVGLETETGDLLVYDREQETAWIQSDFAIELESME